MTHGGYEGGGVVSGDRGIGGLFRGEVAQGRGGGELATPHGTGRQGVATRGRGGEAAVLIPLLTKCRNEAADPEARYRFDYYVCGTYYTTPPNSTVVFLARVFFSFSP